jgi:hypothetical protein
MDSIRASEAPDSGSIPDEATVILENNIYDNFTPNATFYIIGFIVYFYLNESKT